MSTEKSTLQIMEEYLATLSPASQSKRRMQLIRPEVFEYEKKIGKSLFEMNVTEVLDMFRTFVITNKGVDRYFSTSTYDGVKNMFLNLFDYYSRNYQPLNNPLREPEARALTGLKYVTSGMRVANKDEVERAIQRVYEITTPERGRYTECCARLFYEGVHDVYDILQMKADMVDLEHHAIHFPDYTVRLTPRTFELLQYIHGLDAMPGSRKDFAMVPWHDGYFKYPVLQTAVAEVDSRNYQQVSSNFNASITRMLKDDDGNSISYRHLYMLGTYDALAERFGRKALNAYLLGEVGGITKQQFIEALVEHGVTVQSPYQYRRLLFPYIQPDEEE